MKRVICLALCAFMILPLFAGCSNSAGTPETTAPVAHTLQVGFGRVDITPEDPVPLGGYSNSTDRISTEVSDPLYGTCIAFTDEKDNTFMLFHTDLGGPSNENFAWARSDVSKATGVPINQIMISGTHAHSNPDVRQVQFTSIVDYNKAFRKWMVEAAQAAMADRKPAELYTAEARPVGYNFVRHYIMEDGEIIGDNFGKKGDREFAGHVKDPDNQMQLIKITREGGEDIVLVNWQGHPHRAGGADKTNITADLVGAMRQYMEEKIGCKFAYFTGGSANVNQHSRIKTENAAPDYITHGQQLGQIALDALENCKPAEKGYVQASHKRMELTLKNQAEGFPTMDIYAFSIGDIGFVVAPYEMFDTNGLEIKNGSKFSTTFVVTCSNVSHSYIPAVEAYHYPTGEQPYEVGKCKYVEGTGELLAQEFVNMLGTLHDTRK